MFAENPRLDLENLRSGLAGMLDDNWKTSRRSHAQHKKGETETSAGKELVWDRRNVTGSED
jgi:hypothetical protein